MKIGFFYVFYEVVKVHYYLKKRGFGETVKFYNTKYGCKKTKKNSLNEVKITEILSLIDKVCFLFWGDAECLHRSLLGYKLLRQNGVDVELIVGVTKFPFHSHAWLEYNRKIINDTKEIQKKYHEVLRVGGKAC